MALGMVSIDEAAEIAAITQLILSERESRDMGWWDRMADCFHPDSRVKLSWIDASGAQFVEGSIDMARRGMAAKHRVAPPVVRVSGDRAVVSFPAIIDIAASVGGVDVCLSSHARFLYRVERREGRWRICFFDAVYMRDELVPAIPGEIIPITAADIAPYRRSYRMLCFLLAQTGYVPSQSLAGEDVPDSAAALTAEVYGWAGLTPDSSD